MSEFVLTGTIRDVYEDLGPCVRVVISSEGVGEFTFDVSDLPCETKWWEQHIGQLVRIRTTVELVHGTPTEQKEPRK